MLLRDTFVASFGAHCNAHSWTLHRIVINSGVRSRDGKRRTVLGEEQLIDDDIMCVDFVRRQLLHESFRLIQGQEFGYTDTDEGGLLLRSGTR